MTTDQIKICLRRWLVQNPTTQRIGAVDLAKQLIIFNRVRHHWNRFSAALCELSAETDLDFQLDADDWTAEIQIFNNEVALKRARETAKIKAAFVEWFKDKAGGEHDLCELGIELSRQLKWGGYCPLDELKAALAELKEEGKLDFSTRSESWDGTITLVRSYGAEPVCSTLAPPKLSDSLWVNCDPGEKVSLTLAEVLGLLHKQDPSRHYAVQSARGPGGQRHVQFLRESETWVPDIVAEFPIQNERATNHP